MSGREERKRSLGSGHVSCLVLAAFFLLAGTRGWSQTSQATLQGRVLGHATGQATGQASSQDIDQLSGQPIAGALVILRNQLTNTQAYRYTNEKGIYYFSSLMPGTYTVRTDALDFQPEQRSPVELAVAARVELNFDLEGTGPAPAGSTAASAATSARRGQNPSNILSIMYGADAAIPQAVLITLPFFGSDSLLGAISSLIDENKILELPLSGRDVYTLLVLQPGVSSDNATSRGLGFSVNGQQVSSSNFLLNGVDNNDLLVTGPATKLSADAVKEYRMNTNNFTAEFGRYVGFIANVITKSGANRFHGTVYEFFNHDRLNTGSFSDNWQGLEKVTFRQNQFGSSLGGPIKRDRLFFFANLERLRSVSQGQPVQLFLPSPALVATAAEDSIARRLFSQFSAPEAETITGNPFVVRHIVSPPIAQTSTLAFGRLGTHFAFSQQSQDDVAFSPIKGDVKKKDLPGHRRTRKFSCIQPHGTFGSWS